MKATIPGDIDAYIVTFPKHVQKILEQVRQIIKKAAPQAEETISYAMPAFKLNGKALVYFAGYEKHVGLYATPSGHAAFEKELSSINRMLPNELALITSPAWYSCTAIKSH